MTDNSEIKEKIRQLKEQGETVYSISRLNTLDSCPWEYWQTYKEHLDSKANIYSFAGSKIHSCLEDIQNDKEVDFEKEFKNMLEEADFLDINFPSDSIKEKWVKNMEFFIKEYKKPTFRKVDTEKLFLIKIGDNHYLQGIIDLLIYNEDSTISIIDYKTSSKYSNAELKEKGRQLILYGMAMESLGYQVKSIAWNMLKYVKISYKLKNGKTRETIAERGYVVEKLKSDITKTLKDNSLLNEFEIEQLVDKAIKENSFDCLPDYIQNKYTIEDYIHEYDFSEENKKDLIDFINAKIDDIERHDNDIEWFDPKEINISTEFYCKNLCGHRDKCEFYLEYQEIMDMYAENKENNIDFDDLF